MDADKYGCDECYKVTELSSCERCEVLLCNDCFNAHDKREHLYPINRWRRPVGSVVGLVNAQRPTHSIRAI